MNPQQLRQIIDQQLMLGTSLANASADSTAEISLAAVTRRIASRLESYKAIVATPIQPLPSAERLAAFVERETTPIEEQHVVASCVHDMGILFQLVNIVDQQTNSPIVAVPTEVMDRLLSLGSKASKNTNSVLSPIEPDQQSTVQKPSTLEPSNRPKQTIAPNKVTSRQPNESYGHRVTRKRSHASGWLWVGATILAASAVFATFVIVNLVRDDRRRNQDQLSASPDDNYEPKLANDQDVPRIVETPLHSPDNTQIVEEKEGHNSTISDSTELAMNPSDRTTDSNARENVITPEKMTTPIVEPLMLPEIKFGRWEKVVGIMAASPEKDYPIWQAVTESNRQDVIDESRALTWMTPPGCYAQATYGDQGKLVLRENSVASFRMQEDRSGVLHVCELQYGAIYISGAKSKHQVQIEAFSKANIRLELDESTSLLAWTENGDLRFLPQGNLSANGQLLIKGKVVRVSANGLEVIQDLMEEPGWCQQLPKENVLSRGILGNLDQSNDLAKSVDQQLIRLLSRPSTTLSLKHIQQLAQWRVAMDSDSPLRSALSPIPAVRMALFSLIMGDSTETRIVAARRKLLGRLPLDDGRRRMQIIRRQLQPTRLDIAAWLNELIGDDMEIAALADYMFRSQVTTGPDFDPSAPRVQRELSKREWTRVITGR